MPSVKGVESPDKVSILMSSLDIDDQLYLIAPDGSIVAQSCGIGRQGDR